MAKLKANGSLMQKGNGTNYATATTWTTLPCRISISFSGVSCSDESVPTCLEDDNADHSEFAPGKIDNGEVTFTAYYEPGATDVLLDQVAILACWRVFIGKPATGQTAMFFNGYIKSVSPAELSTENNGWLQQSGTIKISGKMEELVTARPA